MSLDPENWEDIRSLGKTMVGDMLTWLETVRERPAWTPVPPAVTVRLDEPVPHAGSALAEVYESFKRDILPYPTGNIHPRFWGWVQGTGTTTGLLADMLASTMNPHLAGYDQSAYLIERTVIGWLAELMGFPAESSGILVSGGTEANINGISAARVAKAGFDVRTEGLRGGPPLTLYGGAETHSWIYKGCELMGLGRKAFRAIPVDADYRIDVAACRARILKDLESGCRPIAIVGTAGTVNTGATDDLRALRALADEFDLWLHVDGAFGALVAWTSRRDIVAGLASADSLAFDLHKWGYMPYEAGVALTRDPDAQTAAYKPAGAGVGAYLASPNGGIAANTTYFADRGLQLSRGFRALKVWMSMKEQGVDRIAGCIEANIQQAGRLAGIVEAHEDLELLAPAPLNVVCLRYAPKGVAEARLNALNEAILVAIQTRGVAVPSQTVLQGRFAIRVCITNHRTRDEDIDIFVDAVRTIGAELAAAGDA